MMKKNFMYAIMSAIALVGAVSFSACSSSEEMEDVNPTFDGEAVKTQFSISLPFSNNVTTRQTSTIVQEGANTDITKFRGMSNIVLIPFSNATDRTTRLGTNITLNSGKMVVPSATNDANSIPAGKLLDKNNNAVLYNDVTIPIGTAGFLFYGEATASEGGSAFTDGRLTAPNFVEDQTIQTSAISFTPTPVLGTSALSTTTRDNIIEYINLIAAAKDVNPNDANDVATWAGCAVTNDTPPAWYNAGLGEMYTAFTSMRAGASSYVMAAVQDLYASIYQNTDRVSTAIRTAILNATYASDSGNSGTLTFTNAIKGADSKGFPADNNMPEGAAALSWTANTDGVRQAEAVGSNYGGPSSGDNTVPTMNTVDMADIVYPASLYYYVSSPIRVSNTSRESNYIASNDWDAILNTYSTTNGAVSSATRSVAITKPIQYAVGRLDVTVSALGTGSHYDRKGEAVAFPTNATAEQQCFPLTGVLIGGQKAVGFNFEQILSDNSLYTSKEYTIYDRTINTESPSTSSNLAASTAVGPTYTLVLETADEAPVYVALEFVNNANDFQGYDGVVKHGCKFYMIAKLDPKATSNVVIPTGYNDKKVFKQDYKTIATFAIGAGSPDANHDGVADNSDGFGGFANAYTTIPDLRTPKLELGLSVNLTWNPGIEFSVTF